MVSGLGHRMSSQRLARASRSRFFIGLGVLLLTMGFVVIYHNAQQELDQLRDVEQRCEQQQEALNQKLITFEQSVQSERFEHEQTKIDLQRRDGQVRELRGKTQMESNLKFGALQQSYKLLKIQNDDLVDECGKLRTAHLEQLGALEAKLKSIDAQHEQILRQRDKANFELTVKVKQLETDVHNARSKAAECPTNSGTAAADLHQQLLLYQSHCSWRPNENQPDANAAASRTSSAATQTPAALHNFNAQHLIVPKLMLPAEEKKRRARTNSTSTTAVRPVDRRAVPAIGPTSTTAAKPKPPRQIPAGVVPLQANDMPADESPKGRQDEAGEVKLATTSLPTAAAAAAGSQENGRYANALDADEDDAAAAAAAVGPAAAAGDANSGAASRNSALRFDSAAGGDAADHNGAQEVMDGNDFLVDGHNLGHKDHMQVVLEDKQLLGNNAAAGAGGGGGGNNAAEEDGNGGGGGVMDGPLLGGGAGADNNDEDNRILGAGGVAPQQRHGEHPRKMGSDPKLMNEIAADQGKVLGYPDDVHLEDVVDEEGDDDEYANPAARNLDPAVRD